MKLRHFYFFYMFHSCFAILLLLCHLSPVVSFPKQVDLDNSL